MDVNDLRRWVDLIAAVEMERQESRRTILVSTADLAIQVEAAAAVLGMSDVIEVAVSEFVPAGQAFVIDRQAIDAGTREALQRPIRL